MIRTLPQDEQEYYSKFSALEATNLRKISDIHDISQATNSESAIRLANLLKNPPPYPSREWLMSRLDSLAEWDTCQYIKEVSGKTFLQLGGSGLKSAMFAYLGAESYLVTPLVEECEVGKEFARLLNVNVDCSTGFAEEIPFADETLDIIYSAGCAHHFDTELAFPEIARVLKPGGMFAAIEPWKSPLHTFGTKLFGKRETEVHCRPLDDKRMQPFFRQFSGKVVHHSLISRYAMLAIGKLGLTVPFDMVFAIMHFEDSLTPSFLMKYGSGVSILGTKRLPFGELTLLSWQRTDYVDDSFPDHSLSFER
jgi:SAM-dependent methyltransferase